MKYRIIEILNRVTNEKIYQVQNRFLFFWWMPTCVRVAFDIYSNANYSSVEEAEGAKERLEKDYAIKHSKKTKKVISNA